MEKYEKYGYIKCIKTMHRGRKSEIYQLTVDTVPHKIRYNSRRGQSFYLHSEEKELFIYVTEKYAKKHGYIDKTGKTIMEQRNDNSRKDAQI